MRTPLCWVTGVDQEKTTSIFPATAANISGLPGGAERVYL